MGENNRKHEMIRLASVFGGVTTFGGYFEGRWTVPLLSYFKRDYFG
jgi:hypothetical protein